MTIGLLKCVGAIVLCVFMQCCNEQGHAA